MQDTKKMRREACKTITIKTKLKKRRRSKCKIPRLHLEELATKQDDKSLNFDTYVLNHAKKQSASGKTRAGHYPRSELQIHHSCRKTCVMI